MTLLLTLLTGCSSSFVGNGTGEPSAKEPGVPQAWVSGDVGGEETGVDEEALEACRSYGEPVEVGTVEDASLTEISGIVVSRANPGVLWVMEDGGNDRKLYALSPSGETVGTVTLDGVSNYDWEALAVGPCDEGDCIFVGDIGDNATDRSTANILKVTEPVVVSGLDVHISPQVATYTYPEGATNAEGMALGIDGLPVVVSKEGGTATVYQLDTWDPTDVRELVPVGEIDVAAYEDESGSTATAADLWPDGSRLLVRTYTRVWEFRLQGGLERVEDAVRSELSFASEQQGEAVAYDPDGGGFWQVSEGTNPTLWHAPCQSE